MHFHNGSEYDFHLIIKELAEEFKGENFECLAENSEKYISFSVIIKVYQVLLITWLKLILKTEKNAERKKKLNQNANLLGLKIID